MEKKDFIGMLALAGWKDKQKEIPEYTLRFNDEPSDIGSHLLRVSISIANYLLEDVHDPLAWKIIEFPMPFFYVGSQLALAQEFSDTEGVTALHKQVKQLQETLIPRG